MTWTQQLAAERIYHFDVLSENQRAELVAVMNARFPVAVFEDHLTKRRQALKNLDVNRSILDGAEQRYPQVIASPQVCADPEALQGCGVVFTAGGDGERLRLSLEEAGVPAEELADFTKATYALPDFHQDFGTLHINCAVMADLCRRTGLEIPVVITTGPEGSVTARVIPQILERYDNFGLKTVLVVKQDERLHFTLEEKAAFVMEEGKAQPITHPDETGGPIMKLRSPLSGREESALQVLRAAGCEKLILLQGTAVYDPDVILQIASAAQGYDGLGVGIARTAFPAEDPFGTYVEVVRGMEHRLCILEKDVRNEATLSLQHEDSNEFLPYNTGFYAFDMTILESNSLPDYATPPKQVLAELEPSPKVGYAGTDILPLASHPAILSIPPESYANLKNHLDLPVLARKAREFGLKSICESI
ncbi:MAG: hypothetical protein ACYTGH_10800 [Planctomycetota bacterium]|jgi:hypothetical protein